MKEEIRLPAPSFSPLIIAIGSLMALMGIISRGWWCPAC